MVQLITAGLFYVLRSSEATWVWVRILKSVLILYGVLFAAALVQVFLMMLKHHSVMPSAYRAVLTDGLPTTSPQRCWRRHLRGKTCACGWGVRGRPR